MKKIFFIALVSLLFLPFMSVQAKEVVIKNDVINGTITADKKEAEAGETVTLTIVPDKGYELKSISVVDKFDEMPVSVTKNSFVMPSYNVYISAEFEKIVGHVEQNEDNTTNKGKDTVELEDTEKSSKNDILTYVICGAGVLLITGSLISILSKKKK